MVTDEVPSSNRKLSPLGEKIRDYQGTMTDGELAERAGISRNQIYMIKRGRSQPTADTMKRLANALSIIDHEGVAELYILANLLPPERPGMKVTLIPFKELPAKHPLSDELATKQDMQDVKDLLTALLEKINQVDR